MFVALVLLSGAGLVAFSLVGLLGAVDELARRESEAVGRLVQDKLSSPALLEGKRSRFDLVGGEVVLPEEYSFLRPGPTFAEAELPLRAAVELSRARRAEVLDGDREAAGAALRAALACEGLGAQALRHLRIEAAWQAHRFGEGEAAERLLAEIAAEPVEDPRHAGSLLRLHRTLRGTDPPEAIWQRSLALPPLERDALHDGDEWRTACADADATLTAVATAKRHAGELRHGAWLPEAQHLVVLQQRGERTAGALLPSVDVADRVQVGGPFPPDALVVLPGVAILRGPLLQGSIVALTAGILVVLVTCFGVGLWLSFRALFRESAAMRARAEFLTSVTHELKTPLASIRLLSEMLDEGRVSGDGKRAEYYRLLAGESARLTVLVENVLDLGRMERGERAYDLRRADPDEVAAEAVRVFAPVAARDGMAVDVALEGDHRMAAVDRGALVQALLNVMDNARKYAAAGGRLELRSESRNGSWTLAVRDHGPGIPAGEREAVFTRFTRGMAQQSGTVAGVGLGLYLARAILRAHGGDVELAPAQGTGAEFVFTLPLCADPA